MNKVIYDELRLAMERIQEFNRDCEDAEFTDAGTAWEVLEQAHDAIEHLLTPTKPREADWRALAIMGEKVVEDFMPNIGRCALQDYGRLNDFLNDMAAAKKEPVLQQQKLHIEILWGENPELDDSPVLYTFNTQAELRAFCEGIEAGDGWMRYEVVYTDEETPTHDNGLADIDEYERRVRALEAEGMTRSDAQAVADAEVMEKEHEPLKKFNVHVRLADQYEAADEDEAFDMMMEALDHRKGLEIMGHDIIEDES